MPQSFQERCVLFLMVFKGLLPGYINKGQVSWRLVAGVCGSRGNNGIRFEEQAFWPMLKGANEPVNVGAGKILG
jgi:hypothetical protein